MQTPKQAARAAKFALRANAKKRFYVYQGESIGFTFGGDTKTSEINHGDVIALSQADADVFRRLGYRIADSESKTEREEIGAPAGDLVADVDTVERAVVDDDYNTAAKLARALDLELPDKLKETVFSALTDWLDTQRG